MEWHGNFDIFICSSFLVSVIIQQQIVYFFIKVVVQDHDQGKAWFYNLNAVTSSCMGPFGVIVSLM